MINTIILHVCPLCGNLGVIHPNEPPSENKNDWQFKNRCPGHRLKDAETKSKGGSRGQKGSERTVRGRDNNRYCRFPFTDQNGNSIPAEPKYREMKDDGTPVAEIAAVILADHNVDSSLWS